MNEVGSLARLRVVLLCGNMGHGGGEEVARQIAMWGTQRGVHVTALNIGCERSYSQKFADAGCTVVHSQLRELRPDDLVKLFLVLRGLQPDVVHTFGNVANMYGCIAARLARFRVVVASEHNPLESRTTTFRARVAGVLAHSYIAVSQACADSLFRSRVPSSKIVVIMNGIELAPQAKMSRGDLRRLLVISDDTPLVGTVGSIKGQKNYHRWLRVARKILDERPDCRFAIVGGGRSPTDLEQSANRLGMGGRVAFLGAMDDVPGILQDYDVFLLTSDREGFGLALCEAQLAGVPVVATLSGGVGEVVLDGRTGFLCGVDDEARLASKCLELLSDPAAAKAMGSSGRLWVESTFNGERMAEETYELYLSLFASSSPC